MQTTYLYHQKSVLKEVYLVVSAHCLKVKGGKQARPTRFCLPVVGESISSEQT
jgi:hypothetical protein